MWNDEENRSRLAQKEQMAGNVSAVSSVVVFRNRIKYNEA